ncbi:hypothetical protein C6P40_001821 [Pichia californica]|uniref:RTA1-domain-containing protein n=1 Tax=Pichia californica TaxID=460514 RepID=A0A9P6WKT3_9ASCO|nr:hypothetical protein C6P42_005090 [[Candida] californica]KAG0687838.1 hypothetical protein C6P40_001821 [[Candida] californica]
MSYIPATGISEGGSIAFAVLYGIICISHTLIGIYYRRFKVAILMFIGTAFSCIGYAGRAWYVTDAGISPYVMQSVCIALGPSVVFGAIKELFIHYITFLKLEKIDGESNWYHDKRLKNFKLYEVFNVVANIISAAFIGSGLGTFSNDQTTSAMDNSINLVLAGFIIQLALCIISIFLWSYFRVYSSNVIQLTKKMKIYLYAILFSFTCIAIRLSYRVAEWGKINRVGIINNLTSNENYLLLLDGMTTLFACVAILIFHPGFVFGKSELIRIDREFETCNQKGTNNTEGNGEPKKDYKRVLHYVPIVRFFYK